MDPRLREGDGLAGAVSKRAAQASVLALPGSAFHTGQGAREGCPAQPLRRVAWWAPWDMV